MDVSRSQEYANFRAWVPRNIMPVGTDNPQEWLYYDWGPRSYSEPLVCLHALTGSAESFFLQLTSIAPRGYRVLSVTIPEYWTVQDFCDGLHSFLNMISVRRVHFYGAGLGGYLAMHYLARRPERVSSIILTHSFLSTDDLPLKIPYSPGVLRWLPGFLVRGTLANVFPKGRYEPHVASAAEFVIQNTMRTHRDLQSSRLALMVSKASVVGRHRLPESRITLIDSIERSSEKYADLSQETARLLPSAKRALLKASGDFPYLSASDEVNMHILVHLRRNAPPPAEPLTIPPPALLPKVWNSQINSEDEQKSPSSTRRSRKELEEVAIATVDAAEKSYADKHEKEMAALRAILPHGHERLLAAILFDCDGSLESAMSNIRTEKYDKNFYRRNRRKKIRDLMEEMKKEEENEKESDVCEQEPSLSSREPEKRQTHRAATTSGATVSHQEGKRADVLRGKSESNVIESLGKGSFDSTDFEGDTPFQADVEEPSQTTAIPDDNLRDTTQEISNTPTDSGDIEDAKVSSQEGISFPISDATQSPSRSMEISSLNEVPLDDRSKSSSANQRKSLDGKFGESSDLKRTGSSSEASEKSNSFRPRRGSLIGRGPEPFVGVSQRDSSPLQDDVWKSPVRSTSSPAEDHALRLVSKEVPLPTSGADLLEIDNILDIPKPKSSYGQPTSAGRSDRLETVMVNAPPSDAAAPSISTPTVPYQGAVQDYHNTTENLQRSALLQPIEIDDDSAHGELSFADQNSTDDWRSFRNSNDPIDLRTVSVEASPININVQHSDASKSANISTDDTSGKGESNEAARLREWRMSAHSASESVRK